MCPHCFVLFLFQIVIDEGQKVGSTFQGDLNRAGQVKVRHDSIFFYGTETKTKKSQIKTKPPHRTHLLSLIQNWRIQQILLVFKDLESMLGRSVGFQVFFPENLANGKCSSVERHDSTHPEHTPLKEMAK